MPNTQYAEYFLGANTPAGFRSLFEQSFDRADGWQVYIIKGGPGTGKSTLMKTIGQRAMDQGLFTELIHCSSDPDSLDAVIIPSLRRAIYDGTAPHVLEPSLPGACERLVDLGQAWDADLLYQRREEIAALSARCSALHRQASSMLACADLFRARISEPALAAADLTRIRRAAEGLCRRFGLTARGGHPGKRTVRLASAVTPHGVINAASEYMASFGRVVPVYDRFRGISGLLLSFLRDDLLTRGYNVTECPCSQDHSRPEHLLLPEEDICFTTRSDIHGEDQRTAADTRAVRTDRFLPEELTRGRHPQQTADRREQARFIELAAQCMAKAKGVHDRLEECYRDAMDFDMVRLIGEHTSGQMLD